LGKVKRVKPNFLGIGSVRGGSTWLHNILDSHPSLLLPQRRKELQYFTKYFNKGEFWYGSFFKNASLDGIEYIGEVTPGYLTHSDAPKRIFEFGGIDKFILILRNPVDRSYSHYKWHLRVTGKDISFADFCKQFKKLAIENSLYYKYLRQYFRYFDPKCFLILIFEDVTNNPQRAFDQIGSFLKVDPNLFSNQSKINESIIPKHRKMFSKIHYLTIFFRQMDLDWIPNLAIKFGAKKLFGSSELTLSTIPKEMRPRLYGQFKEDIADLERLTSIDLSRWKPS
jgi:hypothetical protein